MNKKVKILIIVLVILFVGSIVKNSLFQSVLAGALSKATHVPVRIGSTNLGILSGKLTLRGIRIYNPKSFPEKLMLDAPLVAVHLDSSALFQRRLHFKDVKLNVKEIIVIKNRDGQLNVDALKATGEEKRKSEAPKSKTEMPPLKIDRLSLTVGRVVYKDYSGGGSPMVQEFDVNIQDRVYTNIENPAAIVSLIMFEALTRTTLSRLANLDISSFKDQATGALSQGLDLVGGGADTAENAAKNILDLFN